MVDGHHDPDDENRRAPHWITAFGAFQVSINTSHACVIVLDELRQIGKGAAIEILVFRFCFFFSLKYSFVPLDY